MKLLAELVEAKYYKHNVDYSKIDEFTRHGGAYDRGRADSYYQRGSRPHYYEDRRAGSNEIKISNEESHAWKAYTQGYEDNDRYGEHKVWD